MGKRAAQRDGPTGRDDSALDFGGAIRSVFDGTPFIVAADLALPPARPPTRPPAPQPAPVGSAGPDWQAAIGARLLTPDEEAARQRHFEARFTAAIARYRRRHPAGRAA